MATLYKHVLTAFGWPQILFMIYDMTQFFWKDFMRKIDSESTQYVDIVFDKIADPFNKT